MRRALLPLSLVLAVAATAAVAILAPRGRREAPEGAPAADAPLPPQPPAAPESGLLRPYESTLSLTEDLRDSLAGDPAELSRTLRRVAATLAPKARWVLAHAAPEEASPKVRALLVWAAGISVPDDPLLLAFLGDREPLVRAAAALAASSIDAGPRGHPLLEGVEVTLGRTLDPGTRRAIEERLARETDASARAAMEAALSPPLR